MRGIGQGSRNLFSYVSLEERVPRRHPLRRAREIVGEALRVAVASFRGAVLAPWASVAAARASASGAAASGALQRAQRAALMERLEFDMLFRWFVGLELDERVWDATFTKNRDCLLDGDIGVGFFEVVLERARRQRLLSRDHFTEDGTLVEAWASDQSFCPRDGSDEYVVSGSEAEERDAPIDRGTGRSSDAQGPGQGGSSGVPGQRADGEPERPDRGRPGDRRRRCGRRPRGRCACWSVCRGNPGACAEGHIESRWAPTSCTTPTRFVDGARALKATPHVIQNTKGRLTRTDGRATRHEGYAMTINWSPRTEGPFGWMKQYGLLRRPMGCGKTNWATADAPNRAAQEP